MATVQSGPGSAVTTVGNFQPYPQGRFSGVFSPITLVNANSAPTRLAYLSDSGNHGIGAGHLLGIDSRVALVFISSCTWFCE